ncbi:MAG: zinc ribbon domain-containing protein [Chthoniobacterales bacterium]
MSATPEICPVCGGGVPRGAAACPECGADERSGWREDADETGGLDLPDGEFDYDEFVKKEFGTEVKPEGIAWAWWAAAVAALLAFIAMLLRGAW